MLSILTQIPALLFHVEFIKLDESPGNRGVLENVVPVTVQRMGPAAEDDSTVIVTLIIDQPAKYLYRRVITRCLIERVKQQHELALLSAFTQMRQKRILN